MFRPTKIKIITVYRLRNYETEVNEFLRDKEFVDIKFQQIGASGIDFNIIIVYRDLDPRHKNFKDFNEKQEISIDKEGKENDC